LDQLVATLNELHSHKIDFHTKQLDTLNREYKTTVTMMDNLYLDKLKGKITDEHYDRFHESLRIQRDDINARLARLEHAEDNYYMTARYVLDLANKAYDLFMSSEVQEKRQLLTLVLSNIRVDHKNIVYDVQKPFDMIIKAHDSQSWRG
jgi:site-specific DNA recombinase